MPTPVYPSLPINNESSEWQPVEDLQVDQWPNGASRGRSYFTPGRFLWNLMHGTVTDTDVQTLKTFYDTNRLVLFDFVSPWNQGSGVGVTYHNVGFVGPPKYKHKAGPLWDITLVLRQFL